MINTDNDLVEVYKSRSRRTRKQVWRWRRVDTANGDILSQSSEGYADKGYCLEAARAYNRGCKLIVV